MKAVLFLLLAVSFSAVAQPAITAVLDGGAYTTGIPQGAVFVVKGTGLSASGIVQATAPSYPTVLNNVGIKFTATSGGAVVAALMVYTYNSGGVNQLAAVLPSTAAIGNYNVTVTNGAATSAPFAASVVARKMGIVTADGSGSGQAQATIGGGLILNRTTNQGTIGQFTSRSAHPGERMDLWGTGLGADLASDSGGTSGDQTAAGSVRVVVNGSDVTPLYAGRSSGYPGLDQIAFTLPTNVTPGCSVTVQVRAGGVLGNVTTVGVSASGDACPTSSGGGGGNTSTNPTQSEINAWAAAGTYKFGTVGLLQTTGYSVRDNVTGGGGTTTTVTSASAFTGLFAKYSGTDVARSLQNPTSSPVYPQVENCAVVTSLSQLNPFPNITLTYLDAGPSLNSSGPNGNQVATQLVQSGQIVYNANNVPSNYVTAGNYTFTGPGGPQVGSFTGNLNLAAPLVMTNSDAAKVITRANGFTVFWTGGDPTQLVTINGQQATATGSFGAFFCWANNSAGQFTVPASILNQIPASPVTSASGISIVSRGAFNIYSLSQTRLTAPSGIDLMTATGEWSVTVTSQYQ